MQTQAVSPLMSILPFLAIFAVFYFLLIRPQRQNQKEHQRMLAALEKNDEIVTTGGVHGTIVNVKDKSVILRVDENVRLEIEKNCVAYKKAK
ncbi:MAG: preprotein translocase subunit YajC [Candidatus Omnitrophica bacterium]|nr:preprotein translocase subunit YajC [Candidatus Omnitrophota bacterium]